MRRRFADGAYRRGVIVTAAWSRPDGKALMLNERLTGGGPDLILSVNDTKKWRGILRELNSSGPSPVIRAADSEIAASIGMLAAAGASVLLWATIITAALTLF
jgi:hypothetical protein